MPGVGRKAAIYGAEADQPPVDRRIAELAKRQHGVVSLTQLAGFGLTPRAVRSRVSAGRLQRRYRGVYAVGHDKLSLRGRWMAAVLAFGRGAVLSHWDAARALGARRAARHAFSRHDRHPRRHRVAPASPLIDPGSTPRTATAWTDPGHVGPAHLARPGGGLGRQGATARVRGGRSPRALDVRAIERARAPTAGAGSVAYVTFWATTRRPRRRPGPSSSASSSTWSATPGCRCRSTFSSKAFSSTRSGPRRDS